MQEKASEQNNNKGQTKPSLSGLQEENRILRDRNALLIEQQTKQAHVIAQALKDRQNIERRLFENFKSLIEERNTNQEIRNRTEELYHILACDLKAPLRQSAALLDLFQIRSGVDLDQRSLNYLNQIKSHVHEVSNKLNDLLFVSSITKVKERDEIIDLNLIVRDIIAQKKEELSALDGQIIYSELPLIKACKSQINFIFKQLIENAIKFRRSFPPVITISCTGKNSKYIFAIQDNGIGINPSERAGIFSLFKKISTGKEYAGTGVGLFACQKIIELHNGKIWYSSNENGTTFFFSIPDCLIQLS